MTVQSIDKRVVPEANMTSVTQDKQQANLSVEDAFVSLLHQTTQRFANKAATASAMSADKVLSDVVTRQRVEIKVDAQPAARNDAKDDKQVAAKDPRAAAKADKPRQTQSGAPVAKKADDNQAAPAAQSDDDTKVVAANDDDQSGASSAQDDDANTAQDDKVQTAKQPEAVAAVAQQEQVIVEIDITIEEKVTVVQTDGSGQTAAVDPNALAQAISSQLKGGDDDGKTAGDDLMASLSADDRQRITDLEKRIVSDVQDGNADDALDAATELVSQLVAKVGQHKAAVTADLHATAQSDAAQDQAQDLAAMLGATNVHMDVKVQVNQTATETAPQAGSSVVDALTLMDLAAQAVAQNPDQAGQGQTQGQNSPTPDQNTGASLQPVAAAVTVDAGAAQAADAEAKPFAAILTAQLEASNQADAAPEPQAVAGLANVSGTQAADKASAGQSAQSARTARPALQAQVMEQVTVQIDKQVKDGADSIKIVLKPHELGKVEIKLEVGADGRVSATVTADKPETLAMLQKDSKGLEKALEDAGLKPDSAATSFNLRGGEQQQNADRNNNNQRARRQRGRELGADAQAAVGVQAAQARTLGGRSGVDISV